MLEDKDLVSIQEVRAKVEKAYAAWQKYRHYNQEQIDAIAERMAAAARTNAQRLAELRRRVSVKARRSSEQTVLAQE